MAGYDVSEAIKSILDPEDPTWKVSDKIPLLVKEIESRKNELKTFLASSDYDIQNIISESEELGSESKLLVDDLKNCEKEIEEETMAEIVKSMENYNTLSKELECVLFATNLISRVILCGRLMKSFDECKSGSSFQRAMDPICDLDTYLDLPIEEFNSLDIVTNMRETVDIELKNLVQELYTEWNNLINWEVQTSSDETIVHLSVCFDDSNVVYDIIKSLEICKKLPEKISEFAEFLFKSILTPILHYDCGVFVETDDCVTIKIIHREDFIPTFCDVLSNYSVLFEFLNLKLNTMFTNDPETTLMSMVGDKLNVRFADSLIEHCLIETVPGNVTDLQTYKVITAKIEDFQKFLVSVNLFPSNNTISILKYVENLDVLFANKASRLALDEARRIMVRDLSATMSIGVEGIPTEASSSKSDADRSHEGVYILDKTIPNSLFYFPRCMISRSTQELLDLVYHTMEQGVQCSDFGCKRFYTTTRLIFELYDALMPYHHENYLLTIPQYVALFHNNCMYLAHHMQMLGDKWSMLMEGRKVSYPISFVDLVQKLRDLGFKYLTIHMQQQRKQILDNIRSSDLNCIITKDVLGDNAEAAIRQCLRQLHILKNVWIGVFPSNVFMRLMATLVNMLVEELIHRVCTVEDISMEMAQQLTDMYCLVVQKAPQLFQNNSACHSEPEHILTSVEMQSHVQSWIKLQELIFVLGGSLKDIENHWNDGNGPLAIHFRTAELRSLIKALFQNTQIRANLLSKIK